MLRDILSDKDPQITAVVEVIATAKPDILLLTGFDHDLDLMALRDFARRLEAAGHGFDHLFSPVQNAGLMTPLDLDGDGRLGSPEDAQGYGRFAGARAMAVLSRYPLALEQDHSGFLWADLPGHRMPAATTDVQKAQRLSSTAHWILRADTPQGGLRLALWSATPPLFGEGTRNRDRNHDETAFWLWHLDQDKALAAPFVVMGLANTDPDLGAGDKGAIGALLAHGRLQPGPEGATFATERQELRLSYLLPSADLDLQGSGIVTPDTGLVSAETVRQASRHWLVWADLALP